MLPYIAMNAVTPAHRSRLSHRTPFLAAIVFVLAAAVSQVAAQTLDRAEIAGTIQTGGLILAALIEGAALFAIVVSLLISLKF